MVNGNVNALVETFALVPVWILGCEIVNGNGIAIAEMLALEPVWILGD